MRRKAAVGLAILGATALGAALAGAGTSSAESSKRTAAAAVDPGNFVRHVTNPYFPLKPGTRLVYRGAEEGQSQVDRVFVTHKTKTILGVRTTVVRDVVSHKGHVLERTFDWYAQDKRGNVWYFGENTRSFENGHVSREGSWKAGRDGAQAGIIMKAHPHVPVAYRQEYYKGHAEDQAWVVRRGGKVHVRYGTFRHKLVTFEWTRLEPGILAKKVYAPGIGIALERSMSGPSETSELVRVRRP
jgi:hypothetical protein